MAIEQDLYLPPRLLLAETSVNLTRDQRLRWQPMDICEVWQVNPNQQTIYDRRLEQIEGILLQVQQKVLKHDQEKGKDPRYETSTTRKLCKMLFPCLEERVIKAGGEERLFRGLRLEDYVNFIAFSGVLGFREWLTNEHLPPDPKYRQELELINTVGNASGILDLVRLIGGNTDVGDVNGIVYNRLVNQQVISTLGLIQAFALTDLARDPNEEKLLTEFTDITSKVFPREEEIRLVLGLNADASEVRFNHICRKDDDSLQSALAQSRDTQTKMLNHGYRARIFGSQPNEFAIFHPREKRIYSELLKIYRGRKIPVADAHAARFIVSDKRYIVEENGKAEQEGLFIQTLRQKLGKDWQLEKEFEETRTSSSRLPYHQIKYFAWKKDAPNVQIEVVFEWLYDNGLILHESSWIPYRYLKDINWEALRVRQLLEGPLQHIFPKDCYGIDWDSPETQKELFDYANNKAIYPLVI